MIFAHDTCEALLAAVWLVNSAEDPDTLVSTDQLRHFVLVDNGYTGAFAGDRAELESIRSLRPVLRTLLTSSRDEAVHLVNEMLRDAGAVPQLVRHGDMDWHVHAVGDEQPLGTRIAVETAMAMVDVIRADEMSRLGLCADEDCQGIVLDLSRNRSRRFCSTACGNRAAVAAYRARQSQ